MGKGLIGREILVFRGDSSVLLARQKNQTVRFPASPLRAIVPRMDRTICRWGGETASRDSRGPGVWNLASPVPFLPLAPLPPSFVSFGSPSASIRHPRSLTV